MADLHLHLQVMMELFITPSREALSMNEKQRSDLGDGSSELVAFKLFELVKTHEKAEGEKLSRKWILDTYSECLQAVRAPNARRSAEKF